MPSTLWPTESTIERDATDADYGVLWRLHVDTMRPYVTATYGWVDAVQERLFREAWQWKAGQRVLFEGAVVLLRRQVAEITGDGGPEASAFSAAPPAIVTRSIPSG